MAEIKLVSYGFLSEVESMESAGQQIDSSYTSPSSGGLPDMDTLVAYVERAERIRGFLKDLKALISKDVKDMRSLDAKLNKADQSSAAAF